jgi:uncharacterized protein YjiS (DUF1127 family)
MLKAIFIAYKRHAAYRATFKELNGLSNKELHDLGIDRSQVEQFASDAAYGKEPKTEFNLFKNMFKVKTEKDKIEEYLSASVNRIDLENRLKDIDRGLAPWQIRAKSFAQGWAL